jgi:RecA/RadA recombinase
MGDKRTITVSLDVETAWYLSLLYKRATPERVEPFAANGKEARYMMQALRKLNGALENEDYAAQ